MILWHQQQEARAGFAQMNSKNKIPEIQQIHLKEIVLNPVGTCTLQCKHCSYLIGELPEKEVPIETLKRFCSEAAAFGITNFIILGKEPLLRCKERTFPLLKHLQAINALFGMVTNGMLICQNIALLKEFHFRYIDVSVDGLLEEHEHNRGTNTFNAVVKGIDVLIPLHITDYLSLSSTAMSYNWYSLPKMILFFSKKGIKNFCIGTYVYTGENPEEWILRKSELKNLIEMLKQISHDVNQIIVDIHAHADNIYWNFLIEEGIIDEDNVTIYPARQVYYHIPETNLYIRRGKYTTSFWNTGIITASGEYLDDYEYMSYRNFKEFSLGNIQFLHFKDINQKMREKSYILFKEKIAKIQEKQKYYDR